MKRISLLFFLLIFVIAGCKKEDKTRMTGTVSFDFSPEAGDFYVYMDDDQDLSNGFIVQLIATSDGPIDGFEFDIQTENIPAGSYYLRGGYDRDNPDNMDPLDPAAWEGEGWFGSNNSNPPASPNVSRLYGQYDLVIYALP